MIETIHYYTGSPIEDFTETLMKRRVVQGFPELMTAIVDEEIIPAYLWTDGISQILSVFIPDSQGITELLVINKERTIKWLTK